MPRRRRSAAAEATTLEPQDPDFVRWQHMPDNELAEYAVYGSCPWRPEGKPIPGTLLEEGERCPHLTTLRVVRRYPDGLLELAFACKDGHAVAVRASNPSRLSRQVPPFELFVQGEVDQVLARREGAGV